MPVAEALTITVDDVATVPRELPAHHGTRLHVVDLPVGRAVLRYDLEVEPVADPRAVTELDATVALRPSRYCPSDQLGPWAHKEFGSQPSPGDVTSGCTSG